MIGVRGGSSDKLGILIEVNSTTDYLQQFLFYAPYPKGRRGKSGIY